MNIQKVTVEVQAAVRDLSSHAEGILDFIDNKVVVDYGVLVDTGIQYVKDSETVNRLVQNFAENSEEILKSMEDVNASLAAMGVAIEESTVGTQHIATNITDVNLAMQDMTVVSEKQSSVVQQLDSLINKFKV